MKFVSKEAQNSNIVAAMLNSSQHPGRVFVTSYHQRDVVQMASKEPLALLTATFSYGCSWPILFWANHAPNSEMVALNIVKWVITWEEIDFAHLVKDAKSEASFSPSSLQFKVGRNDVKDTQAGCQEISKCWPVKSLFSRRISSR